MSVDSDSINASDSLKLDSWNRSRSIDELRSFVNNRHALLPEGIDVE